MYQVLLDVAAQFAAAPSRSLAVLSSALVPGACPRGRTDPLGPCTLPTLLHLQVAVRAPPLSCAPTSPLDLLGRERRSAATGGIRHGIGTDDEG